MKPWTPQLHWIEGRTVRGSRVTITQRELGSGPHEDGRRQAQTKTTRPSSASKWKFGISGIGDDMSAGYLLNVR